MNKNTKYGLFEYNTENIGDEVQSIAARRFLPRVDYYFNRDNIDATKTKPNETIKIIMNGWYTHHPENWPPKNPNLNPLLVAVHIEQDALDGLPAKAFASPESKQFLNKYGPVGARNYPTLDFLKKNGVDSYYSGCITLTLNSSPQIEKKNYILAVDVPDDIYVAMTKTTKRPIIRLDTNRKRDLDRETRFLLAEFWLYLYQSAHAVVTTRLHTMLPCLAFGTPVLGISGRDPKRYAGLIDLTNHVSTKEYLKNPSVFNLDRPPKNPKEYLKIRTKLEEVCTSYTKYDSKKPFLGEKNVQDLLADPKLLQFFLNASYDTWMLEENLARTNSLLLQLNDKSHPGIKESSRLLIAAIKKKLSRN